MNDGVSVEASRKHTTTTTSNDDNIDVEVRKYGL